MRCLEGTSLARPKNVKKTNPSSVLVTVTDDAESLIANGRTDDGSDESLVPSTFAERAVMNGIGEMT